jgi:hypothetical protein
MAILQNALDAVVGEGAFFAEQFEFLSVKAKSSEMFRAAPQLSRLIFINGINIAGL